MLSDFFKKNVIPAVYKEYSLNNHSRQYLFSKKKFNMNRHLLNRMNYAHSNELLRHIKSIHIGKSVFLPKNYHRSTSTCKNPSNNVFRFFSDNIFLSSIKGIVAKRSTYDIEFFFLTQDFYIAGDRSRSKYVLTHSELIPPNDFCKFFLRVPLYFNGCFFVFFRIFRLLNYKTNVRPNKIETVFGLTNKLSSTSPTISSANKLNFIKALKYSFRLIRVGTSLYDLVWFFNKQIKRL